MAYIIGISGGSGAGKTSFINAIRNQFSEREVCIISQDNYYLPIEYQVIDELGYHNFDLPTAFDHQNFLIDIHKLAQGQTIFFQEYIFNDPKAVQKTLKLEPAPIIIAEGIFLFYTEAIQKLAQLKIIVDAKNDSKIIRRIRRDQVERNNGIEEILYRYENHVTPAYEKYIAPLLNEVDLIILNNQSFNNALEVITGFIQNKLSQISRQK